MKRTILILLLFCAVFGSQVFAQKKDGKLVSSYADVDYGIGKDVGIISAGYYRDWKLSSSNKVFKKFYLGTGLRFNGFSAKNVYFTSAPSGLYNTNESDSILAPAPAIYAINALLNIGYQFTSKLEIGFDIDVFGFSFGPNGSPTFISNGQQQLAKVNPTPFNLLLVNTNNRGSLLSNIYIRYNISNRWGARISYQKSYVEIKTEQVLQTTPERNDRFRYVSRLFGLGVSYHFL